MPRTSVCDIAELAFPIELDKVWEEILLYEVGMEFSDTVDFLATDNSEIGHADLLGEALYVEICHSQRNQNR